MPPASRARPACPCALLLTRHQRPLGEPADGAATAPAPPCARSATAPPSPLLLPARRQNARTAQHAAFWIEPAGRAPSHLSRPPGCSPDGAAAARGDLRSGLRNE